MYRRFKTWLAEKFGFLRGNYLIIILSYVLSGFGTGLWFPFRSNYIEALGASLLEIGLISFIGSALSALITLPGAYIADRYGRKRIIVVLRARSAKLVAYPSRGCNSEPELRLYSGASGYRS